MFSEEMICSLNDLELEVYKYVVRNADKVCYMRIREFADARPMCLPPPSSGSAKRRAATATRSSRSGCASIWNRQSSRPVKDDVSEVIDFLKKTCSAEFEQKLDMLTRVIFQARHIFL